MYASLKSVDISNIYFVFSDFSVIYFLANRTCVRYGLGEFFITCINKPSTTVTSNALSTFIIQHGTESQ